MIIVNVVNLDFGLYLLNNYFSNLLHRQTFFPILRRYRVYYWGLGVENSLIWFDTLVLGSSQFSILPQLPQKVRIASKMVKCEPKMIISIFTNALSKTLIHSLSVACNRRGICDRNWTTKDQKISFPFQCFVFPMQDDISLKNSLTNHVSDL